MPSWGRGFARVVLPAVVLCGVGAGCGGGGTDRDEAVPAPAEASLATALVAADAPVTAPPPVAPALTAVVTSEAGLDDPGLDAAVSALLLRPDIAVVVVAPGSGDRTASGTPATGFGTTAGEAVDHALAVVAPDADLVVVGISAGPGVLAAGAGVAATTVAVGHGVPAVAVGVERADVVDYGAAAMQLLESLDHELGAVIGEGDAVALRLTVPSCRTGTLRGRIVVDASTEPVGGGRSDCVATDVGDPGDEVTAFAAGYATLARLP